VKGFDKLWPLVKPKYVMFIGIIFLGIGSVNAIVIGTVMGKFMGVLSAPLQNDLMQKLYPNTGFTKAEDILKYEILLLTKILVVTAVVTYIFTSNGKRLFGMLSYNLTYGIRKNLYESILVKNIGYFDFPENSTFVLSGIMQNDTTIINGVATE